MDIPTRCREFDEDLSALLDGELSPAREAEVRAHVDSCARCEASRASLARVDTVLGEAPAVAVPADLRARLEQRLHESLERDPQQRREQAAEHRLAAGGAARPRATSPLRPPSARRRWLAGTPFRAVLAAAAAIVLYLVFVAGRPELADPDAVRPRAVAEVSPSAGEAALDLETASEEELALALEFDAIELEAIEQMGEIDDMEVIANLELLERLLDLEAPAG